MPDRCRIRNVPKMLKIQKINLSRWTVAKRIDVLADDICVTLKDKLKTLFHGALQRMKVAYGSEGYGTIGYICESCGQGVK